MLLSTNVISGGYPCNHVINTNTYKVYIKYLSLLTANEVLLSTNVLSHRCRRADEINTCTEGVLPELYDLLAFKVQRFLYIISYAHACSVPESLDVFLYIRLGHAIFNKY